VILSAPPSEQVERFHAALAALGGEPERLGVAVSGGPDSLALLLLSAAALPGRVEAATVNHGLRPESGVEALHVEYICRRLSVPHTILDVAVKPGKAGLQGEARQARYAALGRWAEANALPQLATAHHQDDQAETVLMRLQRGAGLAGLSGIRPMRRQAGLLIVRPLLGWTKAELAHLVGNAGLAAIEDPSNRDPRFDRTEARQLLRDLPSLRSERLARVAAALREANEALDWAADELAEDRITASVAEWRLNPDGLPRELRRRLLVRAMRALRDAYGIEPRWTGGEDVEGLLAALEKGESATLAGVAARGGTCWLLRPAPPRRSVAPIREKSLRE